jgi:hypothetical protein
MTRSELDVGRLAFGGAVLRGVKLEDYIALGFDWFVVDQCGLTAPFAEGFGDGGNQVGWQRVTKLFIEES